MLELSYGGSHVRFLLWAYTNKLSFCKVLSNSYFFHFPIRFNVSIDGRGNKEWNISRQHLEQDTNRKKKTQRGKQKDEQHAP